MFNYYNPAIQNQAAYEQNLRNIIDQANNQLNQMHSQPTSLTQNFQLAPTISNFREVNTKDEVEKEIVGVETFFLSKNRDYLWIKSPRGDTRVYTLTEEIQKDQKDLLIESLQKQIDELKGTKTNDTTNDDESAAKSAADK